MKADLHKGNTRARHAFSPYLVLLVTLLLTVVATYYAAVATEAKDRLRFESAASRIADQINKRLEACTALLRAGGGLFAANRERVSREQFRTFVERLELEKSYKGVQGIGFSVRLAPDERDALVEQMRRSGFPEFHLYPEGEREEQYAIIYLEPLSRRNRAALGFDMFSEPVRREAMQRARDTGSAAASGRVTLVQELEDPKQAGFLIYIPVYREGETPATVEERRAKLEGFVYSPFRVDDLLEGIFGTERHAGLSLRVFDGDAPAPENLMHDSERASGNGARGDAGAEPPAHFRTEGRVEVAGRRWTLQFASLPEFERTSERTLVYFLPFAGLFVGLLLFFMTRSLTKERLAAESAAHSLAESEIRFRTMVEQSPLSVQIFSPDGRTIQVNRAWEQLWGVTLEQIGDYNILEDQQLVAKGIMPYIRKGFEGEPSLVPAILYDPNETLPDITAHEDARRFVRAFIYPVKDETGRIRQVVLMHEDITERMRVEEALRESEARYRTFTETASDAIITIDEESRITLVNAAAEKIFGYTTGEMLGQSLTMLMPEYLRHLHREGISRYLETGRKHISWASVELPGLHKSGREIPLELSFGEYTRNERRYFTGIVRDITRRKETQEALHRAERRAITEYEALLERLMPLAQALGTARELETIFRALLEFVLASMPCVGLFISLYDEARDHRTAVFAWADGTDVDVSQLPPMPIGSGPNSRAVRTKQIIITNDYAAAMKGHPAVPVGVENGLLPRSSIAAPMSVMGRIIGTIEVQAYQEAAYTKEHATAIGIAANLAAVAIENVRLFDLERRARDEAEQASRLKDEFLATLSHELRTPLTAILGWSRLMRSENFNRRMQERAIETIERNAQAQTRLIDELLDVSRIITGKLRLEVQPVKLASVIEAAIESARPAAEAKGLRLDVRLDRTTGPVSGDEDRLQQIIWNLLSNAIKFTPSGGQVKVRLSRHDGEAEVVVSDTGSGISPDFLPHVFERFRQADGRITRVHGGLGLGLAIVRHLVELHGGTIRAESPGPDLGATFTLRLPLMKSRHDGSGPRREGDASGGGGGGEEAANSNSQSAILDGLRVLVVDDDRDTLELLVALLRQFGAQVTAAASVAEALEKFRSDVPDVLVSDIGMPGEDGYKLIREIRALAPKQGGRVPAAALTAYARPEDRTRSLAEGYQAHITKPVEPTELAALIARLAARTNEAS